MRYPGEFRAVWLAAVLSVLGDQLARVALASLVYERTQSALWTATAWAATFVPAIVGGIWLSHLADRHPRRSVLVGTDLLRAALIAAMALPGMPLWLMCVLIALATTISPVFSAAQNALIPEVLSDALYDQGLAALQVVRQVGQIVGFAVGGAVVVAIGASGALLVDAMTFVASAAVLLIGLGQRPAPRPSAPGEPVAQVTVTGFAGLRAVLRDPHRRRLVLLVWLVGCWVAPEGLAVAFVAERGGGPGASGMLLAALPAGSAIGAWLFSRVVPAGRRSQWVSWLAGVAGIPLVIGAWMSNLAVVATLWLVTGAAVMAYLTQAQADFGRATPSAVRGQGMGAVGAGMTASQGLALIAAGALAELAGAGVAIGAAGATGLVLATVVAATHRAPGVARP